MRVRWPLERSWSNGRVTIRLRGTAKQHLGSTTQWGEPVSYSRAGQGRQTGCLLSKAALGTFSSLVPLQWTGLTF